MKFKITFEEMISETFEINASDMEKAFKIAVQKYKTGEFVLAPGHLVCTQIQGECPETGESTDWSEI